MSMEEAVVEHSPYEVEGSGEEEVRQKRNGTSGMRGEVRVNAVQRWQMTGDAVYTYDIEVEVGGESKVVQRVYTDLLWLHRMLTQTVELGGHILPPMPAPPPTSLDPKYKNLGESSRTQFGEHYRMPCLAMEAFLQALADHPFFSENHTVHSYLVDNQMQATEEDFLGVGAVWNKISTAYSNFWLSGVQDTDEEFAKLLEQVDTMIPVLLTATQSLAELVSQWQKLAWSVLLVTNELKELASCEVQRNTGCSQALTKLVETLEEDKQFLYASSLDVRHSLMFTMDLYHGYFQQAKAMLYRRLGRLQTLLTRTSQLDKASPEKKEAAEAAKNDAERTYTALHETAKEEVELFQKKHVRSFHDSLVGLAKAQLSQSRTTLENLSRIREELLGGFLE